MFSSLRYTAIARSLLMFIGSAVLLSLILVPSSSIAAQTFNPGCSVSQLVADVATAGSNGQADTINLAVGCTYTLTATLTVNADSGNLLTINGNGATLNGNNTFGVFSVDASANVAINNVTISGGLTGGSSVTGIGGGGGIYNAGTLTVASSSVVNNTANIGGGIANAGTLTITNTTVSNNTATVDGGGIYSNNAATLTITNSTINSNTASTASAIANLGGSTLSITSSTINGNTATFNFGTIYLNGSSLTLTNSTVSNNTSAGSGGAIHIGSGSSATISGSTISGNNAEYFGGGIYSSGGGFTLINSTIHGNTLSDGIGGGIYNIAMGSVTITNSTISANNANSAGGIYTGAFTTMTITNSTISGNVANVNGGQGGGINNEGNLTLNNTTVSGNSAVLEGGGIFRVDGSLTLKNSIVANSTASGDCASYGSAPTITNSLIENGGCGIVNGANGNKTGDPNLGALVGNPAYYPLNTGSNAINAGSNALIPGGITTDQAGNPRIQGGTVDMGSFESGTTPTFTPPAPDLNTISNGTFSAGLTNWAFSGTTQQVSNGALQIAPASPGGSFFQFVNFNSAGEIFEVNFRAGNSSATTKTLNLMVRDADWSPLYNCVFALPAYAPFQNYRMRFDTSDSFIPMVLQGALSGDASMGVLIDDITMVRRTGISVPSTECIVSPPPNVDLVYDGAFNQGTANWAAFNAAMQVVNIGGANGNVMELARWQGTPNGGFYQYNPYSAPANGVLQFNFQIGNQSNVARVINMLVRNPDWTDMHSCFITVPANTPLTSQTILLKTSVAWTNIVIQGWIQVGNYNGTPPLPFRFDNLNLQYLPSSGFSGSTQCPAPIPVPQHPTGMPSPTATMTPTWTLTPTATASETPTLLPSATATASETATDVPTDVPTEVPTAEPPTATAEPTATLEPPTDVPTEAPTAEPPTAEPPTETPSPPTPLPQGEGSPTAEVTEGA